MPLDQDAIAVLLPDNTTQQISPEDMRDSFAEVAEAYDGLSVTSIRAIITDDAGDGTVEGDCAATDFAGKAEPDPAPDTFIHIPDGALTTFTHKGVAYFWMGPSGVSVGVGGNYAPVNSNFSAAGVSDHGLLAGLDDDDHPQYHNDARGDARYQAQIDENAQAVPDHEEEADPHPQYLLPEELPQTVVRYYSAEANGTDYTLRTDPPVAAEFPITVGVSAVPVLVGRFVRDTGLANDVTYANVNSKAVIQAMGPVNQQLSMYVEFVLDQSPNGGGLVTLATSDTKILSENRATYSFDIQILGPISGQAGDVVYAEIWVQRESGGGTDNATIYVDGNAVSRNITNIPIPAYPAAHGETHLSAGSDPIPGLLTQEEFVNYGLIKAVFINANGANTANPTINHSYNVASFVRTSIGLYQITVTQGTFFGLELAGITSITYSITSVSPNYVVVQSRDTAPGVFEIEVGELVAGTAGKMEIVPYDLAPADLLNLVGMADLGGGSLPPA